RQIHYACGRHRCEALLRDRSACGRPMCGDSRYCAVHVCSKPLIRCKRQALVDEHGCVWQCANCSSKPPRGKARTEAAPRSPPPLERKKRSCRVLADSEEEEDEEGDG